MQMFKYKHESLLLLFFSEFGCLIGLLVDAIPLVEIFEYVIEAGDHFSRVVDKLHVELLICFVYIPPIYLKQCAICLVHLQQLTSINGLELHLLLHHFLLLESDDELLDLIHDFHDVDVGPINLSRVFHFIKVLLLFVLLDLAGRVRERSEMGIG